MVSTLSPTVVKCSMKEGDVRIKQKGWTHEGDGRRSRARGHGVDTQLNTPSNSKP